MFCKGLRGVLQNIYKQTGLRTLSRWIRDKAMEKFRYSTIYRAIVQTIVQNKEYDKTANEDMAVQRNWEAIYREHQPKKQPIILF